MGFSSRRCDVSVRGGGGERRGGERRGGERRGDRGCSDSPFLVVSVVWFKPIGGLRMR